jgi:tRNA pseudouridine55 synthase
MDGILNLLKPPGMTSHDVVNVVRRITGVRRTGHTGTLDPGAAGVLPVCVGKATRVSEYVLDMDKSYRAELTLGRSTDTEDAAGATVLEMPVPVLKWEAVAAVLKGFLGVGEQIPPMYSAVRINGKKLYELARRGEVVKREPRPIHIYEIRLLELRENVIVFDVTCSRGTYVRTLCREIAEKLGTTGHMSFLLRTMVGPFILQNTLTLEELVQCTDSGRLQQVASPLDMALGKLTAVTVDENGALKIKNGVAVSVPQDLQDQTLVRVYGPNDTFLAVGNMEAGLVKPSKVF